MKTLNVKVPDDQYEAIEEAVRTRNYTSKAEFIRDLVRRYMEDYVDDLHRKAARDEDFQRT